MKHIICILFAAMAVNSVQAQPAKGNLFIGGSVGMSVETDKSKSGGTTEKNFTSTAFNVTPMAGFFLSDKIAVGLHLGITASTDKYPDATMEKETFTQFSIAPFARYYLISGTGGIFLEGIVGTGIGKDKAFYANSTVEENYLHVYGGISPGVYYYITPKLALEAKFGWLGYDTYVTKYDSDNKDLYSVFGFDLSPSSFSFGFTVTL